MAMVFLDTAFTSSNDQGKRETMCLLIPSYESQEAGITAGLDRIGWVTSEGMYYHKAVRCTLDMGWDQLPRRPFYTQNLGFQEKKRGRDGCWVGKFCVYITWSLRNWVSWGWSHSLKWFELVYHLSSGNINALLPGFLCTSTEIIYVKEPWKVVSLLSYLFNSHWIS